MARRPTPRPEDEANNEAPSQRDVERFSDVTRRCPECNTEVYDESEVCWSCGRAFMRRDNGVPKWAIVVAGGLLVLFVFGYLRSLW